MTIKLRQVLSQTIDGLHPVITDMFIVEIPILILGSLDIGVIPIIV